MFFTPLKYRVYIFLVNNSKKMVIFNPFILIDKNYRLLDHKMLKDLILNFLPLYVTEIFM